MLTIHSDLPYPYFFIHNSCHLEQKNPMICNFADIRIYLLPSDHAVDKMSVGHVNENEIYLLYFNCLEITDYKFWQSYKSQAFHPIK